VDFDLIGRYDDLWQFGFAFCFGGHFQYLS